MTRREVWVELIAIARSRDEMGGGAYAAEQEFEEWLQEVREDPDLLAAELADDQALLDGLKIDWKRIEREAEGEDA